MSQFVCQNRRGKVKSWAKCIQTNKTILKQKKKKKNLIFFIASTGLPCPQCHTLDLMQCITFSRLAYFT